MSGVKTRAGEQTFLSWGKCRVAARDDQRLEKRLLSKQQFQHPQLSNVQMNGEFDSPKAFGLVLKPPGLPKDSNNTPHWVFQVWLPFLWIISLETISKSLVLLEFSWIACFQGMHCQNFWWLKLIIYCRFERCVILSILFACPKFTSFARNADSF